MQLCTAFVASPKTMLVHVGSHSQAKGIDKPGVNKYILHYME